MNRVTINKAFELGFEAAKQAFALEGKPETHRSVEVEETKAWGEFVEFRKAELGKVDPLETKATVLLAQIDSASEKTTDGERMVKTVFAACSSYAFTEERIAAIASAIHAFAEPYPVKEALAVLVRRKILRTRKNQGRKLYELNY